MSTDNRSELKKIRTFSQLICYLRDSMSWPINGNDFEELTFEYTPEELGIDAKNAAKIEEIKRLRPLSTNQPWGIFFVKFEPKRLPVVALRRILSQVVLKKRASANSADRAVWAADDLLFISNYGEGGERRISFAHFSQAETKQDLPTLKVLGWDNLDTPLHLDDVADKLTTNLSWPEDDHNAAEWRKRWRGAFTLRHREVINTSRDLSIHLAELARAIRDRIKTAFAIETAHGPLTKLMKVFQESLLHDLDADGFADMYAQTIAYGLLSARLANPKANTVDHLPAQIPVTNPFLKELMETFIHVGGRHGRAGGPGIDFDELGVSEVVELLNDANTNMEAVVRDFGDLKPEEDPVTHFYELFLNEFDQEQRKRRGIYYTPRPVVSYIVRSVDELLRIEFGLADGLADTTTWAEMVKRHKDLKIPEGATLNQSFIQILDPACGTGTFLVEVIDLIHRTLVSKWKALGHSKKKIDALWNEYVPKHLLTRLHGYELLMAPYAIAHLKIGLKLYDTGYNFGSEERARIYLTNALEPASDIGQLKLVGIFPALAHEAKAVNEIKQKRRFTVVVGNPPYSPSISEPSWLMTLLEDWKRDLNETKSDLNREEWKFLRFAQHLCQSSGHGILGFIINRDFLDGITKRLMRAHLGSTFPLRIVVDLNGDVKGNIADGNVFDIGQGVAIAVLSTGHDSAHLRFSSRVGTGDSKCSDLLAKTPIDQEMITIDPAAPYYRWLPFADHIGATPATEYTGAWPINDVFRIYSSGIQTKNDPICIGWTASEIFDRVNFLAEATPAKISSKFDISGDGAWSVAAAKEDLREFGLSKKHIRRILYRPFDWRYTYFTKKSGGFLGRPRFDVMRHMIDGSNIGLIFNRQIVGESVSQFGVSRDLICHGTFYLGNKGQDYLAPLYLCTDGELNLGEAGRPSNFTASFVAALRKKLGNQKSKPDPEEILHYIYSIFHSPGYRSRFAEFLKIDFPRIPLPGGNALFCDLAHLGGELVALHLMESPKINKYITTYIGPNHPHVGRVGYSNETVWLDAGVTKKDQLAKPGTIGFRNVPETVWNFHVGGYQVCHKWLEHKRKAGRSLSGEEIDHYQKIIVALAETIRIMKEIDMVIEKHGGWPGAFQVAKSEENDNECILKAAEPRPTYGKSKRRGRCR